MGQVAYYEATIQSFQITDEDAILGILTKHHGFALEHQQKHAWQRQIRILKENLSPDLNGWIFFEFSIPRMGKRADVVLLINGIVFVLEFKVGSGTFDRYAIDQVHDYALDLKNFHRGSHDAPIVPILIATAAITQMPAEIVWAPDQVATPLCVSSENLMYIVDLVSARCSSTSLDAINWSRSGYQPTPTIVEAALALYRQHDVHEITRSEAGADNLSVTAKRIEQIIDAAKSSHRKAICFITGVPGAGKTLAGLNIATSRTEQHSEEHAVFLSGNGPLVDVLREALARDKSERDKIPKKQALREVSTFVQNIHHFRDDVLVNLEPPVNKVTIFDEAQRAWDRKMASKFMQEKRGHDNFNMSEPGFLLDAMDRHKNWCVVVCLVGGGQEINTGEAGLAEWIAVLRDNHPDWDVHVSSRLSDRDYIWDCETTESLANIAASWDESLHLGVAIRSFRAEALSDFVGHIVDNRPEMARQIYQSIEDRYPIFLTRSLNDARTWLREQARGNERYGLVASSGAARLRPDGIWIKSKIDAPVWFLNEKSDVRSSYYLEETASEFDVQGLELDWTCVCWDADFRRDDSQWRHFNFRGTGWQNVNAVEKQIYLKNAYRVLLTRARQGMAIYIPPGDIDDQTRSPMLYDYIYQYLIECGLSSH